jgi:hypothetical protein
MFYISISEEMHDSDFIRNVFKQCDCAPGKWDNGLLEVVPKSTGSIERLINWRMFG